MCFVFSFIPATILATLGYFVLFSSSRAEGRVQKLGRVLAIWIFIVALFLPICGAYVTLAGLCPIDQMMRQTGSLVGL
jgi:hypothetical protein